MADENRDLDKTIELLASSIESYYKFSVNSDRDDLPRKWAEIQPALRKLQQEIAIEIERGRSIVIRSADYQKLQNSRRISGDMRFQEREFFDFRYDGVTDRSFFDDRNKGVPACSFFDFGNFSGANFSGTKTTRTSFRYAKLIDADLSNVWWRSSRLNGADLSHANLQGARVGYDLNSANLSNANLCNANLHLAHLCGVNFSHANLADADLSGADLFGANFSDADVTNTKFGDNRGMDPSLKQDLMARGAIFEDSQLSSV
jgi:uncharacterized protein YjbI with pentapeptide repeats